MEYKCGDLNLMLQHMNAACTCRPAACATVLAVCLTKIANTVTSRAGWSEYVAALHAAAVLCQPAMHKSAANQQGTAVVPTILPSRYCCYTWSCHSQEKINVNRSKITPAT